MKQNRLKYLSLFVAETPEEVLSMFSEALRILDRNTAELMVDRMKDEMKELSAEKDKLTAENDKLSVEKDKMSAQNDNLSAENEALNTSSKDKDAEIERLKKLLEEQNR